MRAQASAWIGVCLLCFPVVASSQTLRRTPIVIAVEKTRDCVVNISTEKIVLQARRDASRQGDPFDRLFDDFFRPYRYERARVVQPLGSGVILDEHGLVVTNAHVIRRAGALRLLLADGSKFEGKVLAADFDADLALLRIQGGNRKFKPVRMARAPLMLGETVIALGNPFGLSNSVTSGIVSSTDREITLGEGDDRRKFTGLIQTSALINPGNSGGPLVNLEAELVGINTAIVDHAQGIGFAIATDEARKLLAPLLATPEIRSVHLGLAFKTGAPLRVSRADPGSPGAKAGLRAGDVIETFGDRPVADAYDLGMALLYRRPGDRIPVAFRRNGRRRSVTLTLVPVKTPSDERILSKRLGLSGQDVNKDLARSLGLPVAWGVVVTGVERGGPASRAGLKVGDLIVQIGRYRVQSVRQAVRILHDAHQGDRVYVAIVRGQHLAQTRVRLR